MKNKIVRIAIVLVLLFLLIPIPVYVKDGGTVHYEAIIYTVSNYHMLNEKGEYDTGIEIKILGITVYKHMDADNEILH
jgi:hypothetical protein